MLIVLIAAVLIMLVAAVKFAAVLIMLVAAVKVATVLIMLRSLGTGHATGAFINGDTMTKMMGAAQSAVANSGAASKLVGKAQAAMSGEGDIVSKVKGTSKLQVHVETDEMY